MTFLKAERKTVQYGAHEVTFETAKVARQATGAVICTMGNTMVLATVVGAKSMRPGQDFFPLSVHYQEKYYAIGKIPGGYLKREGRPSEKETLTSRLIDRPIRPLFPKGFMNEVQVIINVISADRNEDPDICAMLATSAALSISGLPFAGPIAAARVCYTDEAGYTLNPDIADYAASDLDMVVAGTDAAVLMVESEAKELSEDVMLGGVLFGHDAMQPVIAAIKEFAAEVGKPQWDWSAPAIDAAMTEAVETGFGQRVGDAYLTVDKMERVSLLSQIKSDAVEALVNETTGYSADDIKGAISKIEKRIVRQRVVAGEPRIDGRDNKTVRAIEVEVGVLPRAHGSALFTRGETQALVACTLGTKRDSKMVDDLSGLRNDPFMLHYNFPPFSVGEAGRMGGVGRREIGHGRLARRGVAATLPDVEEFPYTIRVVSEITESNGSSSMASVCGTSLAMMDAGIPVTTPVAGIAMGLVKEDNGFAILTDILGDEDHLGDMDFKVAGSAKGITALQMDIKIQGITEEIMESALEQAHDARIHILAEMALVISASRPELSPNAPSYENVKIDTDKIRDVIGKGGATIRALTEETQTEIDISDDGTIRIYAPNQERMLDAKNRILAITAEAEIGAIYRGKVVRIADFGAFVNFLPGKDGLVHISQICERRLKTVDEELSEGQEVAVKVLDVDNRGRVKLTMKEMTDEEKASV
jgi:polyribonucleotide nucleotidyltransferase